MILNSIYINPSEIQTIRDLGVRASGGIWVEIETDKLKIRFYCDDEKYSHILHDLEIHKPMMTSVSSLVTEIKQPPKRKWWQK